MFIICQQIFIILCSKTSIVFRQSIYIFMTKKYAILLNITMTQSSNIQIQYLKILFPVEYNSFGFHFSVFDINFISTQDNWNILTHSYQVSMPVRHIFVCYSWSDIKHYHSTLSYNTQYKYHLDILEFQVLHFKHDNFKYKGHS